MKKLLVIGGLGNIGYHFLKRIENDTTYHTICIARPSKKNKRLAKKFSNVKFVWADLFRDNIDSQIKKADVIVNLAAILPPISEARKSHSQVINRDFVQHIVNISFPSTKIIQMSTTGVKFYNTKSKSIFFAKHYLSGKKEAEDILGKAQNPYTIIRIPFVFDCKYPTISKNIFNIPLQNKMEFIHTKDVVDSLYLALTQKKNIITLGGNPQCQITYHTYLTFCFGGIKKFKSSLFTKINYPTDWISTPSVHQKITFQDMVKETKIKHPFTFLYRKIFGYFIMTNLETKSPYKKSSNKATAN